jgi:predicted acylesterase/phospholipase RssA
MSKKKKEIVYHFDPLKIKYLAFEGGGGKGVAFLGAIAALEKMKVIKHKNANDEVVDGTVLGISGSSAGAITGFLLSLGYDTIGLANKLSKTQTFVGFYDGPEVGKTRAVINNTYQKSSSGEFVKNNDENNTNPLQFEPFSKEDANGYFQLISNMVNSFPDHWVLDISMILFVYGLPFTAFVFVDGNRSKYEYFTSGVMSSLGFLGLGVKGYMPYLIKNTVHDLGEADDPLTNEKIETPFKDLVEVIAPDLETFKKFLKNVFLDRGLFPGFAMRNFFRDSVLEAYNNPSFGINLNQKFIAFNSMNKINFKTVSVNITSHKPQVFSAETTPDFPVVDAVGMSSSFPFAFKPVLVKDCQSADKKTGPPDGYYGDGGIVINLPMHLFDEAADGALNENMLGIRLENHHPEEPKQKENPEEPKQKEKGALDIISGYAGDVMNTMLFPTEEGQIRNKKERQQTIALDVTGLETLQFVSPIEKSGPKIIEAYIKTRFMLDKDFKVKLGAGANPNGALIFDPIKHYIGITPTDTTTDQLDQFLDNGHYDFDLSKFETVLGVGIPPDDEDEKGKMVLKLIGEIMDTENAGTFAAMLNALKK